MPRRSFAITAGVAVMTLVAGHAAAQSRSSFLSADGLGSFTLTEVNPTTYKIDLGASPTLTYLGVTYPINSVFGVWALSNLDNDFGDSSSFGVWSDNKNLAGGGGIVGWKTNPNDGLGASSSQQFVYTRLTKADVVGFGYHIRVDGTLPGGGNTAYFTAPVPAPGAVALLSSMGLVALRRRR